MLGAGEGRQLISGQKPAVAFNAKVDFDVFRKKPKGRQRQGLWARM
jgi:hypothetical protein